MGRALLCCLAFVLVACSNEGERSFQGYAEGEYVRVAAPFAGTLEVLAVKRGTQVKAGDPLFTLEQENEAAARREARERLRNAEAQLANLQKGKRPSEIEAIRAQLAQAEAALALSTTQLKRQEQLVEQNFIARERLDEARATHDRDVQRVAELQALLATARLAARPDEIKAAEHNVEAAKAALAQAEWKLDQKSVKAAVAGLVQDTYFVHGEWVNANQPVVSLLPPQNIKARFFVPERELGAIRLGQKLALACDGCPAPIPAVVSFISPQAEYTPPVIYSQQERAKLVFLIEARPAPEDAVKLHPGQPLEVRFQ
ncbi:MAG TPA: HlyD family efflux transporter periplasmic adaptor subunit [Burkholderiales bacterium]|nr:HlyD family efflux transporter periplasmic adaptor subunit [Burkholderiales bacterium]